METEQLSLNHTQLCTIAINLAQLMKLRKTNENKVAQELNIPVMTIRRLLSGETTDPRISTLKVIAEYFNVSVDTLISVDPTNDYTFQNQTKPVFVPKYAWDNIKDINKINLQQWKDWVPVVMENHKHANNRYFALESKPSMTPRFQPGTIFILDPDLLPSDGDLVLVNIFKQNASTLRELFIDPPESQLYPVSQGSQALTYSKEEHKIIAVVFLTLFYNRKT